MVSHAYIHDTGLEVFELMNKSNTINQNISMSKNMNIAINACKIAKQKRPHISKVFLPMYLTVKIDIKQDVKTVR